MVSPDVLVWCSFLICTDSTTLAISNACGSVHAAALSNVAELAAGASVLTVCQELKPKGSRAMPVALRSRFYKPVCTSDFTHPT